MPLASAVRRTGSAKPGPRAAENGPTERQLNASFGWTDGKMVAYYTMTADRARLAREAIRTPSQNNAAASIRVRKAR
jgi:hypothetical protein